MMRLPISLFTCIRFDHSRSAMTGVDDASDSGNLDPNYSYCFSYTWIGTDHSNETKSGDAMTCADFLKENNSTTINTPCVDPIVFSDDLFSAPDADDLWNTDKSKYVCKRAGSQSCVKYTVSFSGTVQYETHMCSRVRTKKEQIKKGCLTETRNGDLVEVCICETSKGVDKPCNASTRFVPKNNLLFCMIGAVLLNILLWTIC